MTEIRIQAGKVTEIPLGKLKPDPANPRQAIAGEALQELADSIKAVGVLQPLTIRKHGKGLMIVHGERRWRAAKLARLKTVPCLLSAVDDDAVARGITQVAENTARANLAPMDLARWLAGLKASEKLSPNEIAARLDKAGLKAMTRAQVDDLIRLTDLPAWAQGMVDAGQMEASAAGQLLKLKDLPAGASKVAAAVIADRVKWSGKATAKEVAGAIWDGIRDIAAADLTHTSEYMTNPVLFNWKTRCKLGDGKSDCPHLVKHAGGAWCMDKVLFAKHQAEAKRAGLGPGGKRVHKEKRAADGKGADGDDGQAEKAEQRERSLSEKVRDYLHVYLVRELAVAVEESAQLQQALVLWAALKKPGSAGAGRRLLIPGLKAPEHDVTRIEHLTATDMCTDVRRAAAIAILLELPWRETHAVARQIWGDDLQSVWGLDAGFLDLSRKAELARLAEVHECALPEGRKSWAAMKGSEIKEALLSQAEKITHPAILVDLYSGPIEAPYKPWSPDDDDGTDDGVDWESGDETGADDDLEDAA